MKIIPGVLLTNSFDEDIPMVEAEIKNLIEAFDSIQKSHSISILNREDIRTSEFSKLMSDYENRIVIFHFAGHANNKSLAFSNQDAQILGLAELLKHQKKLFLVFLNGCATYEMVSFLLEAGIPAIIATQKEVFDEEAFKFSSSFYHEWIIKNNTLVRSFGKGSADLKLENANSKGSVSRHRLKNAKGSAGLPGWGLFINPDFPWAEHASFSQVISDPLIGIPPISEHIPFYKTHKHFKGLTYYKKEDAHIFFGRNRKIKEIFEYWNDKNQFVQIIYGKSGVGKSSLISAGFLPRIGIEKKVYTIRKDHSQNLKALMKSTTPFDLLILDQLERILYDAHSEIHSLFKNILCAVQDRKKIFLLFRKEYLAEMLNFLDNEEIQYVSLFVEPLMQQDLEEIITSLSRIPASKRDYKFEDVETLANKISYELYDPDSSVAPIFQILMGTLYQKAMVDIDNKRILNSTLFDTIGKEGKHLYDYVKYELNKMESDPNQAIQKLGKSGLALDFLNQLTDPKRIVAMDKPQQELLNRYLSPELTRRLTSYLEEKYLILTSGSTLIGDKQIKKTFIGLSHDTLAKEIIALYNESAKPVQQGLKILHSKSLEKGLLLNKKEFSLVKVGLENINIEGSEVAKILQESEKDLNKGERAKWLRASIGAIFILAGAVVGWWYINIQQPQFVQSQIGNIEAHIKEGDWESTVELYKENSSYSLVKEHFLTTLIEAPKHASSHHILELGRVIPAFKGKKNSIKQASYVAAYWLSYTPYWKEADEIWASHPNFRINFSDSTELRREAGVRLDSIPYQKVKQFFPSFVPIPVFETYLDSCLQPFEPFLISQHELRVLDYLVYLNLSNLYSTPKQLIAEYKKKPFNKVISPHSQYAFFTSEKDILNNPVQIQFSMAEDYCFWAGYDIPSYSQWSYAAQPYCQTEITPQLIQGIGAVLEQNKVSNVFTGKNNAYGLFCLIGNVAEWIKDCKNVPHIIGGKYNLSLENLNMEPQYSNETISNGLRPFKMGN